MVEPKYNAFWRWWDIPIIWEYNWMTRASRMGIMIKHFGGLFVALLLKSSSKHLESEKEMKAQYPDASWDWNIYHTFYGTCRQIFHTWSIWDMFPVEVGYSRRKKQPQLFGTSERVGNCNRSFGARSGRQILETRFGMFFLYQELEFLMKCSMKSHILELGCLCVFLVRWIWSIWKIQRDETAVLTSTICTPWN